MEYVRIAACVPAVAILLVAGEYLPNLTTIFAFIPLAFFYALSVITYVLHNPRSRFLAAFTCRYYRFAGHYLANKLSYKPCPIPDEPTVTAADVHVILPTIDPDNTVFDKCIRSILSHEPRWLTVVTDGVQFQAEAECHVTHLRAYFPKTTIVIVAANSRNKRVQTTTVLKRLATHSGENKNTIVVCVDDHVWWHGEHYLCHLIAPFEDPKIGLVGTNKRIERVTGMSKIQDFVNFVGCTYLERHNFDTMGQNTIDGGVQIISARTCALRASILMEEDFLNRFPNDRSFYNRSVPLNSDDDNFITRYVYKRGWNVKFQNDAITMMYTTTDVDGFWKVHGQLLCWARSQWRRNSVSFITEGIVSKRRLWWTGLASCGAWFINATLWMDAVMVHAWYRCEMDSSSWSYLFLIIIGVKVAKFSEHFKRHPWDLKHLPAYVLFTYFNMFYKVWTLCTFWNTTWTGRRLTFDGVVTQADDGSHDAAEDDNVIFGTSFRRSPALNNSASIRPMPVRPSRPEFGATGMQSNHIPGGTSRRGSHTKERPRSSAMPPSLYHGSSIYLRTIAVDKVVSGTSGRSPVTNPSSLFQEYGQRAASTGQSSRHALWESVETKHPHLTPAKSLRGQLSGALQTHQFLTIDNLRALSAPPSDRGTRDSISTTSSYHTAPEKIVPVHLVTTNTQSPPINTFRSPSTSSSTASTHDSRSTRSPYNTAPDQFTPDHRVTTGVQTPTVNKFCAPSASSSIKSVLDSASPQSPNIPAVDQFTYDTSATIRITEISPVARRSNYSIPMPPRAVDDRVRFQLKPEDAVAVKTPGQRIFTRGGDCQRVHGSGSWLSLPKQGTLTKCRSPQPNLYRVR